MKFVALFKTPNVIDNTIEAVWPAADVSGISEEEQSSYQTRRENAEVLMERFVHYGEYVHIEFDTVLGTATVLPK